MKKIKKLSLAVILLLIYSCSSNETSIEEFDVVDLVDTVWINRSKNSNNQTIDHYYTFTSRSSVDKKFTAGGTGGYYNSTHSYTYENGELIITEYGKENFFNVRDNKMHYFKSIIISSGNETEKNITFTRIE